MSIPPMGTPAGWYPDASDPRRVRYWDGAQWTGQVGVPPGRSQFNFGSASLIIGSAGVLLTAMLAFPVIGPFLAIVVAPPGVACAVGAIVLGVQGRKRTDKDKQQATIGLAIGCVLAAVYIGLGCLMVTL